MSDAQGTFRDVWDSSAKAPSEGMPAASGKGDPDSSRVAAKRAARYGRLTEARKQILAAVARRPGRTSAELAREENFDRVHLARRLPELRRLGLLTNGPQMRVCRVTRQSCLAWLPANQDQAEAF